MVNIVGRKPDNIFNISSKTLTKNPTPYDERMQIMYAWGKNNKLTVSFCNNKVYEVYANAKMIILNSMYEHEIDTKYLEK